MRIGFRIDWGYQYLYSRRHYHPQFIWDGSLTCDNGYILHTYQLDYPVIFFGPGQCARETELPAPEWVSHTKRRLSGVRFEAEAGEDTVFHLKTISFSLDFTAKTLLDCGRMEYSVGPKYLGASVIITKDGFLWFRPEPKPGETVFEAEELDLPVHDWARMRLAWLAPGESVTLPLEVQDNGKDLQETVLHLVAMGAPAFDSEKESVVKGYIPVDIGCDGQCLASFTRYYRFHDYVLQILEDDWERVNVLPGKHSISLTNRSKNMNLAISRISFLSAGQNHGELSVPEWMLRGETLIGKVFAAREDTMEIRCGGKKLSVCCKQGWNEFSVHSDDACDLIISTDKDSKTIFVYDVPEEKTPVKVGYDMTVVPHDQYGIMDWLLDYTSRTRLGNYVVFRSFTNRGTPVDRNLLTRWGDFCRTHDIWVAASTDFEDGVLCSAAGERFHDCGIHEFPHPVYARDPEEQNSSEDMKEAMEKFIRYLKEELDKTHEHNPVAAFGDPSGGSRYCFLAGADFVRAETMIGNTQTLLSQVRPAAESLGQGKWGVHIAIQHCIQPYHETHLGQYFLSLFQAWMMGAEVIYEEDSLFELFKEERQTWDDLCTKGKRDMTRRFFRFVKTHPRTGRNVRRIAFLEGRYAAPFNGFICGSEQDPHYSVWGKYGSTAPEWGHGQPEKCRAVLDVLMPGASTHPFRQKFEKRRFFFAGTPYGDFDCMPVEAETDYWQNYKLLLNLGWNTCLEEDMEKLRLFVKNGGTLLTGIPQFSAHIDRQFLKNMDDLNLINDGDLSDLCGIRVKGKGGIYCGQWNCAGREQMQEPELSSMPSDNPDEDGAGYLADVELCGAEVVAWDSFSGLPMLVRKQYGKGTVYTLTLWAYPGHECFQRFSATWVSILAKEARGTTYVEDESGEIFWTKWIDGKKTTMMLLNTDWTKKGNIKTASLVHNGTAYPIPIRERSAVIAEILDDSIKTESYTI